MLSHVFLQERAWDGVTVQTNQNAASPFFTIEPFFQFDGPVVRTFAVGLNSFWLPYEVWVTDTNGAEHEILDTFDWDTVPGLRRTQPQDSGPAARNGYIVIVADPEDAAIHRVEFRLPFTSGGIPQLEFDHLIISEEVLALPGSESSSSHLPDLNPLGLFALAVGLIAASSTLRRRRA